MPSNASTGLCFDLSFESGGLNHVYESLRYNFKFKISDLNSHFYPQIWSSMVNRTSEDSGYSSILRGSPPARGKCGRVCM